MDSLKPKTNVVEIGGSAKRSRTSDPGETLIECSDEEKSLSDRLLQRSGDPTTMSTAEKKDSNKTKELTLSESELISCVAERKETRAPNSKKARRDFAKDTDKRIYQVSDTIPHFEVNKDGDTESEGDFSDRSAPEIPTFKRGKRGRPVTTGEYYLKQEHDKQVLEAKEKEMMEEILDPNVKAKKTRTTNSMKQAEKYAEEFQNSPVTCITTRVMDSAETIRKVAEKSSKIKGDLKNALRKAANLMEGAITEMEKRIAMGKKTDSEAIEEIRGQLEKLRWENEKLKREVEVLKGIGVPVGGMATVYGKEPNMLPGTSQGHPNQGTIEEMDLTTEFEDGNMRSGRQESLKRKREGPLSYAEDSDSEEDEEGTMEWGGINETGGEVERSTP